MIKFADFEADEHLGQLSRQGERIKLQDLPFRMLVALLQRPGAVVTRDELRAALWGDGTYVDAEAGLNTAAAKLREALGDNAEQPKFIETIPKRGYRFIGAIEQAAPVAAPVASPAAVSRARRSPSRFLFGAFAAVLMLITTLLFWFNLRHPVTIAVVRFHNETGNPQLDRLASDLTDAVVVALASNPSYSVIGNSPVLRTDRIFEDVGKIGVALDATFVVLGQLQTGDTGLVARAHFIRTADAKHLWADKIDLGDPSSREERLTSLVQNGVTVGLARNK